MHAAGIDHGQDTVALEGDAQHLDRQRRLDHAVDLADQRDAPHHAVHLLLDGDQAQAHGRAFEDFQIVDQRGLRKDIGRRVGVRRPERPQMRAYGREFGGLGRLRNVGGVRARLAEDGAHGAHGLRHHLLVGGQILQRAARLGVGAAQLLGHPLRRGAVRLGEDGVEPDHRRALIAQRGDQVRHHRARPRPLTQLAEAFLVDVDDDDRALALRLPRLHAVVGVEGAHAHHLHEPRIDIAEQQPPCQNREGDQRGDARLPPGAIAAAARALRPAPVRIAPAVLVFAGISLARAAAVGLGRHFVPVRHGGECSGAVPACLRPIAGGGCGESGRRESAR